MNEDWRLNNQKNYLFRKQLRRMRFIPNDKIDHAHCAFCWEKFGLYDGMTQEGYKTVKGNWWICNQCFEDFNCEFEWEVVNKKTGDGSLS